MRSVFRSRNGGEVLPIGRVEEIFQRNWGRIFLIRIGEELFFSVGEIVEEFFPNEEFERNII